MGRWAPQQALPKNIRPRDCSHNLVSSPSLEHGGSILGNYLADDQVSAKSRGKSQSPYRRSHRCASTRILRHDGVCIASTPTALMVHLLHIWHYERGIEQNNLDFIFGTDFFSRLAVSNLLLSVYYSCAMHSLGISHADMRQRNTRHKSYY